MELGEITPQDARTLLEIFTDTWEDLSRGSASGDYHLASSLSLRIRAYHNGLLSLFTAQRYVARHPEADLSGFGAYKTEVSEQLDALAVEQDQDKLRARLDRLADVLSRGDVIASP